jgi:hypothetical protein
MGFLDRLLGRAVGNSTVTRTSVKQHFRIKVPADQARAVQAALERWAQSKGWAAVVNAELEGDQVSLSLEHDESGFGTRPQIETDKMTDELQKVVQDAIKPPA